MSNTSHGVAPTLEAERPRVLLIDDSTPVRRAMASLLAANGFDVVGQAEDGDRGTDLVHELEPDVVLLDVRMPRKDGLSALEDILRLRPETKVLMMSMYQDANYILQAVSSGAAGYLFKGLSAPKLIEAVRRTAHGESFLDQELLRSIRTSLLGDRSPTSHEVIEAHLRVFGALARALLDPDPPADATHGYYARVEAVTAYGLAVSVLVSAQRSERQRLEAEIAARTAEIRRAQEKLVAAERRASLARLAASAAHGVRNPLAVIVNAVTALEMSPQPYDPMTVLKYAQMVHQEVDRADSLLSQLVRYAHVEDPDLGPCRLPEIVELAVKQTEGSQRIKYGRLEARRAVLADIDTASEAVALFLRVALLLAHEHEQVHVTSLEAEERGVLRISPFRLKLDSEEVGQAFEQPLLWRGPAVVNFDLVLGRGLAEAQGAEVGLQRLEGDGSYLEISWPLTGEAEDA